MQARNLSGPQLTSTLDDIQTLNMNFFLKAITFLPNFTKYLKAVSLFHGKQYYPAIKYFEKCLNHPSLNNELLFSYYGQSLCAVGRLEEACPYLIKAGQLYESYGWAFKDDQTYNVAKNTIAALKHIYENTDIEIDRSLFDAQLRLV